jgi:BirA family biotin operon repressor/biotin-[acetyl-CoA-carboxylase] ligase
VTVIGTLWNERLLREAIARTPFVKRLVVVGTTASTNDDVRVLAGEGAPSGTVLVADEQTAGRGRLGRSWHSSAGLGVYVSVLVRTTSAAYAVTRWTLGASLAACKACGDLGGESVEIRWPNDLYHAGRKLAGTLLELRSSGGQVHELVVGTGFNVNHDRGDFPDDLRDRATSLREAVGTSVDRERLAAAYLERFGSVAEQLEAGRWGQVRDAWSALAPAAAGTHVRIRAGSQASGQPEIDAVTRGVDDTGALRVERVDGSTNAIHLGDSVVWLEA